MSSQDDFFGGMKNPADRTKEWTDAAEFYVGLKNRGAQPEEVLPEPPVEKQASLKDIGAFASNIARTAILKEPTGTARAMASSRPALIGGLAGAALVGTGIALSSRGKKEHNGQSSLEHSLHTAKNERDRGPEPESFSGKIVDRFQDLNAGLATAARKHPIKAGLLGALGGAKAGAKLVGAFTGKVK